MIRPKDKVEMISEGRQKSFRSMIGTLLYLVRLSRPDLANPVRELLKVMDGAGNVVATCESVASFSKRGKKGSNILRIPKGPKGKGNKRL